MPYEKMFVKFTEDYTVKDSEGKKYTKGQRVSLPLASAHHFIRNNRAVPVQTAKKKKADK